MAFSGATVAVGSDVVYYVHGGKAAGGTPLVLIHGLSGATTFWAKNIEPLGRHTEVYALDLPGFGRSPIQGRFDIERDVAAVIEWISAIRLPRAIFVGHSLGAYVTAKLAMRLPESVSGLVMVAPAMFPPGYGWQRLAIGLVPAPFNVSLSLWPTLLRGALDAGPSTILRATRELLEYPILDELPSIRAPTLLILGDKDSLVPRSVGARIKSSLGDRAAGPVLLHGGHVPMWDDPDGFQCAVIDFLSKCGVDGDAGPGPAAPS